MELKSDMLTVCSGLTPVIPNVETSAGTGFEGHEFFEASSIRKFNGRYYFIYSSVQCHELCWAISDRPNGGFRFGGTLISNGDIGFHGPASVAFNGKASLAVRNYIGNNHGSVEKVGGSYFVFYHRQTNRHMFSRQACVAKIQLLPDGTFVQAEMTSQGMGGPLPGIGTYDARIACNLYSKQGCVFSAHPMVQNKKHPAFTQDEQDGEGAKQYIGNLRDGATAVFKYFRLSNAKTIRATVRGKCSGTLLVQADGQLLAKIPVSTCKAWASVSAPCQNAEGEAALSFTFQGKGAVDFPDFTLKA